MEMNKIGESSNTSEKIQYAVSYAVGKVHTDQFYLENSSDFKSVEIVKKLPKRKQLRGKIQSIDEVIYLSLSIKYLYLKKLLT
jgi:hypothetical protein